MEPPILLPTQLSSETFAGVTYYLDGQLVPVLTVEVGSGHTVYFEHHVMLWKNTEVRVRLRPMKGALKRMIAGMQVFLTEAHGAGHIAFSRDGVGHIFPIHLQLGEALDVREHQFLAATDSVVYGFTRMKGISNILIGSSGFFIDRFVAKHQEGIVWLHGYGNVFEKVLKPGEQIDVEPGAWLYKDPGVKMATVTQRLTAGLFGGGSTFLCNRFTGPGRVGIQSMSVIVPGSRGV